MSPEDRAELAFRFRGGGGTGASTAGTRGAGVLPPFVSPEAPDTLLPLTLLTLPAAFAPGVAAAVAVFEGWGVRLELEEL